MTGPIASAPSTDPRWGSTLFDQHRDLLIASAVSPGVARERGYVSVDTKGRLKTVGFSAGQQIVPGLLLPLQGVDGTVVGVQYRPDRPREVKGKVCKYEFPTGQRMRLDVHPRVLDDVLKSDRVLWITEGIRKGDSAVTAGLCCIALLGVWNWRGTRSDDSKGPLEDWDHVRLDGRDVVVAFDSDVMTKPEVQNALSALSDFLHGRGASVKYAYLPPGDKGQKTGLDDFLAANHSVADLEALVEDNLRRPADKWGRRYTVDYADAPISQKEIALRALVEANEPPALYSCGGLLARVATTDDSSHIQHLKVPTLRDSLERQVQWLKLVGQNMYDCEPPHHLVVDLLEYPDHDARFPRLEQVVTTPYFAPGGSLVTTSGYNEETHLYLDLGDLLVPPLPTPDEALKLISVELLGEFPFESDADLANALALFLLPFARPLIDGVTPFHLLNASTPGSGKGLLADVLLYPVTRGSTARMTYTTDDDELRKRITSVLIEGQATILMDNITKPVDSGVFAAALTSPYWVDRILGVSRTARLKNLCIWFGTANNPALSIEIARRTVFVRLDPRLEQPWLRTGFRHSDLKQWAAEHRGQLVAAGLAIVKAWVDAGMPRPEVSFGDYTSWVRTMAGILQVAGVDGFLANATDRFEAASSALDETREFVTVWWNAHRDKTVTVKELLLMADFHGVAPDVGARNDQSRRTAFGMWLRSLDGRVVDDKCIVDAGRDSHSKSQRWRLEDMANGVSAGIHLLDQGFRDEIPAQPPSAEPCGTSADPPLATASFLDDPCTHREETGVVEGPAGFRKSALTCEGGAEPSVTGSTGVSDNLTMARCTLAADGTSAANQDWFEAVV